MSKTRKTDPVDLMVSERIRSRRIQIGISQEKLGDAVGVTFQQIQKYEKGHNRVSPGRLSKIAKALDVDTAYFFGGGQAGKVDMTPDRDISTMTTSRDGQSIIASFAKLSAPLRRQVAAMMETMVAEASS